MSVSVRTYVIWGVILPDTEAVDYDQCAPYFDREEVNPRGGMTVLYDGMNGDYVVVGHVIARTDENQHFEKPITIPNGGFPMGHEKDLAAALAALGIDRHAHAAGWHIISHYS